jgi:hypothetical protein
VVSLARAHVGSRLLLLRALRRARTSGARAALEELADNRDLGQQARRLLGGGR